MDFDVLVIGAGPAGSSVARLLARRGFAVALADQKEFPRHKPCGEFLSPQCQPVLADMGLDGLLQRVRAHRVQGMQLAHGRHAAHGRFRRLADRLQSPAHGFAVRRERFDAALVDEARAAGVHWLPRHRCVGVLRRGNVVRGARLCDPDGDERSVSARFVLAADGVRSPIAAEVGLQRRQGWLDQFALVAHFRGVPALDHAEVHLLRAGFFAGTTVDDGCFALNLVVPRRSLQHRPPGDLDAFVAAHLERAPLLAERLAAAQRLAGWRGCGPFAFRTTRQWLPGLALVGDAAGYVDPLTGEGIYFALLGASLLAPAIDRAITEPARAADALSAYAAARHRELAARLGAARWLQRGLRRPWVSRAFVAAARRWRAFADLVVTLSGDSVHPRELWRPGFWRAFRAAGA